MAVVAEFTADVTGGANPLTVNFTDLSPGSPTHWQWNFGDGYTSSDQNPSHTYTENGAFTVTLRAWISTGTTTINATLSNGFTKKAGPGTYAQTSIDFAALGWSASAGGIGHFTWYSFGADNACWMQARYIDQTFDLSPYSESTSVLIFNWRLSNRTPESFGVMLLAGGNIILPNPLLTLTPLFDVSSFAGGDFVADIKDGNNYAVLSDPDWRVYSSKGWSQSGSNAKVIRHSFGAGNNDIEIKTDYICVGVPIADFSADVKSGANVLQVNFTNLTTCGITYSWQKRKAGTSDPFVEFSTDENPSHNFDKEAP